MYALLPSAPEPGSAQSPDQRRKKRWALGALALAGLAIASTVSQWATVRIVSSPPGVLDSTSYVPTGSVTNISTPPMTANGARFTHWTVNGVRQVDAIGISQASLSLTITNSVDLVAYYVPETQDQDADLVPDWYELLQYGNLATGANDDTDSDGLTLTEEYVRGSQPQIRDGMGSDGIVLGGISRRRSPTVPVRNAASPQFYSYTESSLPPGAVARQEWVPPGTSLTTTALPLEQWGYKFGQWKLNGVRQESSSGMAASQITFTITQDSTAVAEYVPLTEDTDGDAVPDWYEVQQYGNILTGAGDDTDGDGVGLLDEYKAGSQPRIADYASGGGILEGGISRRRSEPIRFLGSSTYFSYTERSEPPGAVNVQSSHPAGTPMTTSNLNGETWGYRFTHWTLNGVRQQTASGLAASQVSFPLNENTVAVANFLPVAQDLDADQLPDWYEMQQYGSLGQGAEVDTDGDGLGLYDEYLRGTQPLVQDNPSAGSVLEGGTSRRRGAAASVDLSLLLEDFNLATNPAQESNSPVKVGELTSTSSAIGLVVTTNPGFQVFLVGGKYEIWTAGPTDYETTPFLEILLTVTNSRGTSINLNGTVALTDNRMEDADGDGLTEAQEEDFYGTSDTNPEFDGDGYGDGAEVIAGTSPADMHSFPWEGEIPLPSVWVKVANGTARDLGFRGDWFISVEQSSVDGAAWNTNSYGTNTALFGFAGYGDGLWWGTGTNGVLRAGANTNAAALAWEAKTSPETNSLGRMAYGQRTFLARGPLGTGYAVRSTNGLNWTNVGTASSVTNSVSLAFNGSQFLMAAGTNIRFLAAGGSATWSTNPVTNQPAGFLLTNLLARNGTVYAGSSLAADTNGRRTMVVGQSTSGTNWSFQTSSLVLPAGVELAEVAHGLYFAVPTVTNGNAWFLVSSNASNWLKVGGAWTNGRVARGIAAGAGQLAVATDEGVYAGRFNRTGKDFTTTHENFTAAVGTNWTVRKPFSDSDVVVTNGMVRLINRGTLILEREFDGAFEASGRLRFAGSSYDALKVVYASDKSSTNATREMNNGIFFGISSRGGDSAPFGPKAGLSAIASNQAAVTLGSADPAVPMSTWTDFRITDDGRTIRVYWDDLVNPVITTNHSGSRRGYFAIYNREGSGGGSSISAGSVVEVERLTIRGAEVLKQSQTITFPPITQKTYGDPPFSLGAAASSGLPLTYASDNTAVAIVSTNGIATITGVGTSRITVSQPGNTNYYPASSVEQTLTVVARAVTIRADDLTRAFGQTNPPLTSRVSVGSLVAGHTHTANLATTATTNSPASGSPYPITVSGAVIRDALGNNVTGNYEVTLQNGSLQITAPPVLALGGGLSGFVGVPLEYPVTAAGTGPITFGASNLPAGLGISSANGLISGTPTMAGSGTATVTAANASGTTSGSLAWVIEPSFLITSHPTNLTVNLTEPAAFSVGVNGPTNLTYQWRKGGVALAGKTGPVLSIPSAQVSDRGGYDVVVQAGGLARTSSLATLTVVAPLQTITGTVRDFRNYSQGGHPDFDRLGGNDRGIVAPTLGPDRKPVYAGNPTTLTTSGQANFDQWYRNVEGVNLAAELSLTLAEDPSRPGVYVYDNDNFFPIDGQLHGNGGYAHNYGFTYELHLEFTYRTGDAFTFRGDDDVWVFMNGRRVIDLGGVHPAQQETVSLDAVAAACGMTPGNTYPLDIFFAERARTQSSFRIEATMFPIVTRPPQTATITLANLRQAYDGSPKQATAVTTPDGLPVTVTYNGLTNLPVGVGVYEVRAVINDPAYQATPAIASFEIYNPVLQGSIELSGLAHRYDGTGKAATVGVSPTNAAYTVTYNGSTNLPVLPGSYQVVGTLTGSYAGSATNTLVISPKVLSVTNVVANVRQYDGSTEVGVDLSGASLVGVVGTDRVSLFGITASGVLQGGPNPGLGKLVVVEGLMLDGEEIGNYELGAVVTTVDILPRGLGIRAKDKSKAYGEALPVLEWELVDPQSLATGHSLQVQVTTTATNSSGVGEYAITVGTVGVRDGQGNDVSGYYGISRTDGKLTINRAVPGHTWPAIGPMGYGTALGTNQLNATSPVAGNWSYSPGTGTVLGAGPSQAVVGTFAPQDTTNYAGLSVTNRVTVNKAKLVIRAVSEEIELGRQPALEYVVEGLVNNDRREDVVAGVLGTDPVFNTTLPGVYRMVQGTVGVGQVGNYEVERFEEGVLRVKAGVGVAEGSVTPLAGGYDHSVLLRKDGGVSVWGSTTNGLTNVPVGLTNVAGVAAGSSAKFSLAWRKDGTATGWGNNSNVIVSGVLNSLSNVVGMAGGDNHGVALLRNGTVRAWGTNNTGQTNAPANLLATNAAGFIRVVAVSAAQNYTVALRSDGRVQYWGTNSYLGIGSGLSNGTDGAYLTGITNAVGVGAGSFGILTLHADGSVQYRGLANFGSGNLPGEVTNAASLATNPVVAVAAGGNHGLAMLRSGRAIGWGDNNQGQTNVAGSLTNVAAVAGGQQHSLLLSRTGSVTVVAVTNNPNRVTLPSGIVGAVPQGGPDSDGDGWSNEAELRAGSHPLNAQSLPGKVVLAGTGTNATVIENGSLVVGTFKALDRMGWEESLVNLGGARLLGPDAGSFEVVGQELRLKTGVDYETLTDPQLQVTLEVQGLTQDLTITVQNDPSDDDTVAPVITLLGANPLLVDWGASYSDPGARVTDNVDAERTMTGTGAVDVQKLGLYTVIYTASDLAGNRATNTRTVQVRLAPLPTNAPPLAGGVDPVTAYALQGGSAEGIANSNLPQTTLGPTRKLRITAVVRTNDPNLSVNAWASASVLGPWTNVGAGVTSTNQTGVDRSQFERREYEAGGPGQSRVMLRLQYTYFGP